MGYPALNGPEGPGYPQDTGLREKGANFKGKKLYLVHGGADGNVHVQHTNILTQALIDANIQYKLQVCTWKILETDAKKIRLAQSFAIAKKTHSFLPILLKLG